MSSADDRLAALHAQQYAFAAHLRDPHQQPAPAGIEERRLDIYRDLFFNNVVNFLGGHFPICRDILETKRWRRLVRGFYRDYRCSSPLFADMPREFLTYLSGDREPLVEEPPFLVELAHYEWVEAGLLLAPDAPVAAAVDPAGDLLAGIPALRQPAWLLTYRYAVNEIGVARQPTAPAPQPLYYLVLRNACHDVVFNKLNAVSARLYALLEDDEPRSGRQALEQIATELRHATPDAVISSGANILQTWRDTDIILGTVAPAGNT
ncbi:MAG: putative DNA-binding domain-containing protein [Gammaproteobacteria bacterium]|nr:putative DNA-binding domain-containing protein [Gammaproteobacteria bacterium]